MKSCCKLVLAVGTVIALALLSAFWPDFIPGQSQKQSTRYSSTELLDIASMTPASSVRCNRISLPAHLSNATSAPYNPAAMRHPVSGDWYLLHSVDEVCAPVSVAGSLLRCQFMVT